MRAARLWGVMAVQPTTRPRSVVLDDLGERGLQIGAHGSQRGMHGQRPAEERGGRRVLLEREVTETLAGQRAEVMGLAGQRGLAVADGPGEVVRQVARGGALVPRLGPV